MSTLLLGRIEAGVQEGETAGLSPEWYLFTPFLSQRSPVTPKCSALQVPRES
jgi:hypothetical protein